MSCPDWRRLAAAREADPLAEVPGWVEARAHAATCDRCRSAALAADPLLLFARRQERSTPPTEITEMQASVMALVRASRVAPSAVAERPPSRWLSVSRVAAALGACSLLALSGAPRISPTAASRLADALSSGVVAEVVEPESAPAGSAVEELDRPGARIYELPQADMAVVMIVDASLDV